MTADELMIEIKRLIEEHGPGIRVVFDYDSMWTDITFVQVENLSGEDVITIC